MSPPKRSIEAGKPGESRRRIERVQTGLRIEKRLLKVLKGVAELHDISLGDLIEGIVLHVFEGKLPLGEPTLEAVDRLRNVYGLDLTAADSHLLVEIDTAADDSL